MGTIATNNELKIRELQKSVDDLLSVIPFCKTRDEANEIQEEIDTLQDEIAELEQIESEVCPECGNYLNDPDEEFPCMNDYHNNN